MRLELARDVRRARTASTRSLSTAANAWIGLVACGHTYHELRQALRTARPAAPTSRSPTPASGCCSCGCRRRSTVPCCADFASGLAEILVVEDKNPTLEWMLKEALYAGAASSGHHRQARRAGPDAAARPTVRSTPTRSSRRCARGSRSGSATIGWRRCAAPTAAKQADPAVAQPHAVLLQRLPAQHQHSGAGGRARRRRHRLPLDGGDDGARARRRHRRARRAWATRAPSGWAWRRSSRHRT